MTTIELLGYLAGFLTTAAFLPQAIQIWRSRSAKDISLPTYLIFCAGVALWLVYGLLQGAAPVVAANAVTLVLALAILAM